MSKLEESCGQWLSAKNKRTKQVPKRNGKGKQLKHKGLLNFATSVTRSSGGLDIQVSCSPLSPRTRKKLKTAKQSKISKFLTSGACSSDSKCDKLKRLEFASKMEDCMEGRRAKVSVKRHRSHEDPSFCGYFTELENEQEICRHEKEGTDQADCNISGVSNLSDSFEDLKGLAENDSLFKSLPGKNRESLMACTLSPPHKKFQTSKSRESVTESSTFGMSQSSSIESELSESFHFSQWRKDQIAKCKEIQDVCSFGDSSYTDESSMTIDIGSCVTLDHKKEETELSETPPFQFTQWAKQQVQICREIQKQGNNNPNVALHHSHSQDSKFKTGSTEASLEERSTDEYESQSLSSDWEKIHVKTSKNVEEEIQEETDNSTSEFWEIESWDGWKSKGTSPVSQSLQIDESEFQFSDWVKSQIRKCKVIQEEDEV